VTTVSFDVSEYVDPNWEISEADVEISGHVKKVKNGFRNVGFRNLPDSECRNPPD
jgi:hypothetical protein